MSDSRRTDGPSVVRDSRVKTELLLKASVSFEIISQYTKYYSSPDPFASSFHHFLDHRNVNLSDALMNLINSACLCVIIHISLSVILKKSGDKFNIQFNQNTEKRQ